MSNSNVSRRVRSGCDGSLDDDMLAFFEGWPGPASCDTHVHDLVERLAAAIPAGRRRDWSVRAKAFLSELD